MKPDQETRHQDSHYVIHYIIVRHSESYLDTTDIIAPRPPVWPYSYVSVDHAVSRRYGRCQSFFEDEYKGVPRELVVNADVKYFSAFRSARRS